MDLYLYLFAGMLVYAFLGLTTLNKQTPALDYGGTIKAFINLNKWNLLAGLILGVACISFLSIGQFGFLKSLGFNVLSNPESAFVLGMTNQWLLKTVRQIFFRTGIIETKYNQIKTTKGD